VRISRFKREREKQFKVLQLQFRYCGTTGVISSFYIAIRAIFWPLPISTLPSQYRDLSRRSTYIRTVKVERGYSTDWVPQVKDDR